MRRTRLRAARWAALLGLFGMLVVGGTGTARADVPEWHWYPTPGNAGECIAFTIGDRGDAGPSGGIPATVAWTTAQDPVCSPKTAFDQVGLTLYRTWPTLAGYYYGAGTDLHSLVNDITIPGEGTYSVDFAAQDNTGHWYPRTTGLLVVGHDSDGDRVVDSVDRCPAVPGDQEDGCPSEANRPPVVVAGADQVRHAVDTATVHGTVTDDGLPGRGLTYLWTKVSGPGTAAFTAPRATVSQVTFSQPGRYVLRLTAGDGALTAHDELTVTVVEHYRVEIRAWIPQPRVVDPVHPLDQALVGNTPDSWSACGHRSGPMIQSSTFRGDDHRTFDSGSGSFRGRVWAEFDWDGTSITALRKATSPAGMYGATHRDFTIRTPHATIHCTRVATATKSATATQETTKRVHLDLHTSNPLVDIIPKYGPAPAIDSDLLVTFAKPTELSVSGTTDLFPSHGFRIWRNGKVLYTRTTNQAACVDALGPVGAYNLFTRLTHQTNRRSLTLATHTAVKSVDEPCR
ncbi:PKD domain-containing protein [Actinacidiphila acididurans]|uniref:PKD domain-containing protein n=1 Tax=Actinacidiphila acididurans TaxID=2784346 RepID=A0ABS2TRT7_9ACTN|nr:PKD domain-containing protein [Actinacidiphila acididurans]MBM9506050.1 PKD domain-containing protein [Actinacidiphila acididurans]